VIAGVDVAHDLTLVRLNGPPTFDHNSSVLTRTRSLLIRFYICDSNDSRRVCLITDSHVCLTIVVEYKKNQEDAGKNNRQPAKANT
jgi:hypothetical protein